MSASLLWAFWGATFFLIAVPGPDWAYTLTSGVRDRVVFPAVGGLVIGYTLLTLLVAAGVGVLIAGSPILLSVLTVVGSAYLVYLGVSILRDPGTLHARAGGDSRQVVSWWVRVGKGVGVSTFNPKGLLIFLALLPQFTDPDGSWPVTVQIAALGLIFAITCGVFYSIVGLSARAVLRTRHGISRVVSRISGVAMILVGVFLLAEKFVPMLASATATR